MTKPFLADMAIEEVRSRIDLVVDKALSAKRLFSASRKTMTPEATESLSEKAKAKLTEALAGLKSLLREE